jgi:hypothetical protein
MLNQLNDWIVHQLDYHSRRNTTSNNYIELIDQENEMPNYILFLKPEVL